MKTTHQAQFVRDIMTTEVLKLKPSMSINEASHLFNKHKIRHAPVVKNQKLVGIVSLTDLQRMSFGSTYGDEEDDIDQNLASMMTIYQIMRTKPVTTHPDTYIKEVAEKLVGAEFHALPVVNDDKLVGIVTTTDIIRALLGMLED